VGLRAGQVRKIAPPPGFDPRTVQPVGSRYTDYATWPTVKAMFLHEISLKKLDILSGSVKGI
jgi:hypothetical protein